MGYGISMLGSRADLSYWRRFHCCLFDLSAMRRPRLVNRQQARLTFFVYIRAMPTKFYFLILPLLLFSCSKADYIQFEGNLIEESTHTPVAGCKVQFSDNKQMYGYAITDDRGTFNLIVEPPARNRTYKLTMTWNENYPHKEIKIEPPLQKNYTYNQYIVYDKTNPYSLPTFDYSGYKYYVHPTLQGLYTWSEAKEVCNELVAYEYDDWFLPYLTEIQKLEEHPELFKDCEIINATYWTSAQTYGGYIHFTNFYNPNEQGGVTQNAELKMHVIPFRSIKK